MTKESLMSAIEHLPENFNLDTFMEDLLVIEKIEKGKKELDEGKSKSHEEVTAYFRNKWAK
jgi:hypothetical protein